MKLLVTTSNKSAWTLKTYAHLWNKYFSSDPVDILCESVASVESLKLPSNYKPIQAGETWGLHEWTDGLIRYLNSISDQQVLIMLDDYWVVRPIDKVGIERLANEYLPMHLEVLRVDLTSDRLYAGGPRYPHDDPDFDTFAYYDLVNRPKTQYQMSLMPGLWNKAALLSILRLGWNPWQVEIEGTNVVNDSNLVVVGTRQNPIKIVNALRNASTQVDLRGLRPEVVSELHEQGHLPAGMEYIQ